MHITTSVEEINPARATAYLATMAKNRPVNGQHLSRISREMRGGAVRPQRRTYYSRRRGPTDRCQHRLRAVVATGATITVLVVRGVETETAFASMGQGRRRSLADRLSLEGHTNCLRLAGAVTAFVACTETDGFDWNSPPLETALRVIRDWPEIVEVCSRRVPDNILRPAIMGALATQTVRLDREDDAYFWSRIGDGANLEPTSPILRLRATLLSYRTARSRISPRHMYGCCAVAWNKMRRGEAAVSRASLFKASMSLPELV